MGAATLVLPDAGVILIPEMAAPLEPDAWSAPKLLKSHP
jgi:hypothetical protein